MQKRLSIGRNSKATLICLILLSPTILFEVYSIIAIPQPQDIRYILWFSHINILDISLAIFIIFDIAFNNVFQKKKVIEILALLLLLSGGLFLQAMTRGSPFLPDGVISHYRLIAFLLFAYSISKHFSKDQFLTLFCYIVFILSLTSIFAVITTGYRGSFGGRINFLGLGVNGTAEFCFIAITYLLYNRKRLANYYQFFNIPIISILLLSGSRRTLVFLIAFFLFTKAGRKPALIGLFFITITAITVGDVATKGDAIQEDFKSIARIFNFVSGTTSLQDDGRIGMYAGAFNIIQENPLGTGISDWEIQRELHAHTTGSHTHNFLLQNYLKFGPFLLFGLPIFLYLIKSLPTDSHMNWVWANALLSFTSGYGFWNYKYLFVYCVLYVFTTIPNRSQPHSNQGLLPQENIP